MHAYQPMVAVLNDLLRVTPDAAPTAIVTALQRICAANQFRGAAVYAGDGAAGFRKSYRFPAEDAAAFAVLPDPVPAALVAAWFPQPGTSQPKQITSGAADGDKLILFPMEEAGAICGLLAFAAPLDAPVIIDAQFDMLRLSAEVIRKTLPDPTSKAALQLELARIMKIVESMDNLVALLDPQLGVEWVNATFENHTGWKLDEIRGKRLGSFLRCPDSDPAMAEAVNNAIARRAPFRGSVVNMDRFGNRYWVDFNILPRFSSEGAFEGYVTIETIVTKHKEQEIAMARLAAEAEAARVGLANAIEALPDGVVIFDAQSRLVAVNSAYRETFPRIAGLAVPGVTLEELLRAGLNTNTFLETSSEEAKAEWLQKRLAEYRLPRSTDEVPLPDGRWLRRVSTRTADGGVVAIGIDITSKRNRMAALDEVNRNLVSVLSERDRAEQRLKSIFDGAGVGSYELNVEDGNLFVAGHWGEIVGLETRRLTKLTGQDFLNMVHPDDHAMLPPPREFALGRGSETIVAEFRMRHADGHWVWVLSRSRVAKRAPDGTAQLITGVHIDISDRKQLEQEITARRAFLLQVIDASIAPIVVLDEQGDVLFANQEAARILGVRLKSKTEPEFDISALRLERLDGEVLPKSERMTNLVAQARGPVRDVQVALRLEDGTRRVLACNAAPLDMGVAFDTGVIRRGTVISFTDITDDRVATARLEEAVARAEDMSRAKSTFLANMSHEIRTPLNGVLGMAEVLAEIVTEPAQKRMVSTIRKSGETLLTVLNGILDMSKIEAGKMELEAVPFLLSDLLREVEAIYSIAAEEKGVAFEVMSSAGSDKPRLGDPHRLMQILNNLLNNAIKFTNAGRVSLKVSCRVGKPLTIEVADSGVGMEPAQLSRVFESFEQADGSMTRRFGGTGLGLTIVRQLVTLMGGEISVESRFGVGTKFRVTLPLPETEMIKPVVKSAGEPTISKNDLAGLRILSADDNATNRLVMSEMLASTGAELTHVENGRDAISVWQAAQDKGEPFSLICLDITMPVLDGMSALSEIRMREEGQRLGSVPAIAVTAHAMPNQVADYIVGGFDTHIAKPFKQRDLLHAVRSLLET